MLIKILLKYIFGFVRISVEGYYLERFINICNNRKILIWNIKREKQVKMCLNIGIKDFRNIVEISKITKCKTKIISKKGVPFLLHKYKKRKVFAILLLIVFFLICSTSNFIWNIQVEEENNIVLENIEEDLQEAGLKVGASKNKIGVKEIINNIRLKRNDIAWIGIELKGTNAIVKIVKADEKPNIINQSDYCDIISDKTAEITKITAQVGTIKVGIGQIVNPGDVLISGTMEGKYTGIRYVHSIGEIEAVSDYTKSEKFYYVQEVENQTGNIENKYKLKINNFEINFSKRLSKFEFYDTIENENKFKIFSNFYLPISIVRTTNKEKVRQEKVYTLEEAKNIEIEKLKKELEQEISNKDSIKDIQTDCIEYEDYVEIFVTYKVIENIGTEQKIVF